LTQAFVAGGRADASIKREETNMNETLNRWWAEIQNIINYPLIELGDSRLTLNSIVKLLLVMTLVVVVERFLRRIIRRRVLAHTHLEPDLQYAISRLRVIASSPWVSFSRLE
jgi:hypothetical protein